jgi:hypothetical protein
MRPFGNPMMMANPSRPPTSAFIASAFSTPGAGVAITLPAGIANGDVLIFVTDNATAGQAPAGATHLDSHTWNSGSITSTLAFAVYAGAGFTAPTGWINSVLVAAWRGGSTVAMKQAKDNVPGLSSLAFNALNPSVLSRRLVTAIVDRDTDAADTPPTSWGACGNGAAGPFRTRMADREPDPYDGAAPTWTATNGASTLPEAGWTLEIT